MYIFDDKCAKNSRPYAKTFNTIEKTDELKVVQERILHRHVFNRREYSSRDPLSTFFLLPSLPRVKMGHRKGKRRNYSDEKSGEKYVRI